MVRTANRIEMNGISQNIGLAISLARESEGRFKTADELYTGGMCWDKDGRCIDRRNAYGTKILDKPLRNANTVRNAFAIQNHFRGLRNRGRDFVICYNGKLLFFTITWRNRDGSIKEEEWKTVNVREVEAPKGQKYVYGYHNRHYSNYKATDDDLVELDEGIWSPYGDIHILPTRS